jgi:hypothetical protein
VGVDDIMVVIEHALGEGGAVQLKWPGYFQLSAQDMQMSVTSTVAALSGGLIDDETTIGYTAPYFKAEDVAGLVAKVRTRAGQQQADIMAQMQSAVPSVPGAPEAPGAPTSEVQDSAAEPLRWGSY